MNPALLYILKLLMWFAITIGVSFCIGYFITYWKNEGYNPHWKPEEYDYKKAQKHWIIKLRNKYRKWRGK